MVLTREQSEQVRAIKEQQRKLGLNGWMCEGSDDDLLMVFNNGTQQTFVCDYYGNIKWAYDDDGNSFCPSKELKKFAELEGMIYRIAYQQLSKNGNSMVRKEGENMEDRLLYVEDDGVIESEQSMIQFAKDCIDNGYYDDAIDTLKALQNASWTGYYKCVDGEYIPIKSMVE